MHYYLGLPFTFPINLKACALLLYEDAQFGAALIADVKHSIERFKSLASAALIPSIFSQNK